MSTTPVAPLPAGAPATPTPSLPINPAPLGAGSTREDAIAAAVAGRMNAAAQQLAQTATPPAAPAPAPVPAAPAQLATLAQPADTQAEPESPFRLPDLDSIDFDKPDIKIPGTDPTTPTTPATPPPSTIGLTAEEAERAYTELEARLKEGDAQKIEEALLRTPRGKAQLQIFKTFRELAHPPTNDGKGGIGRIPTIDEIKMGDQAAREVEAIRFDLANNMPRFAENLVMFGENGQSYIGGPQQVQQFLSTLPEVLWTAAQQSPVHAQLFDAYAAPLLQRVFDNQFSVAQSLPEITDDQKATKLRTLNSLRDTEFIVTQGRVAREVNLGSTTPSVQSGPDPRLTALQQENQRLQAQQTRAQQEATRQTVQSLDSTQRMDGLATISKVFEASGITKVFPDSILDPVKESLYTSLSAKLASLNPTGWQRYQQERQQVASGRIAASTAAQSFRGLFQNAVRLDPSIRSVIGQYIDAAKAGASNRRAGIVDPQMQVAPAAQGTPVQANVAGAGRTQQAPSATDGMSHEEKIAARLRDSMVRNGVGAQPQRTT